MEIAADNLALGYDGYTLFKDVTFTVCSGQKVCIAGPSGSGKSSLLRAMLGFVQPQQGTITIDSQLLSAKTIWELRKNIAYITQEPDLGRQIVLDRIRQPFAYKANASLTWSDAVLDQWFECFKLTRKLLSKQTADLSGGQKQRIAIIIGLLLNRPVLLLDEPTSALDKESKQILKDVLCQLDKTIIFVSHEDVLVDIAEAAIDLTSPGSAHE